MITDKQFTLPTKFGNVAVKINEINAFYVSARLNKEGGWYGEQDPFVITIRNKHYNHFSIYCGLKSNNTIDGHTYAANGNDCVFVSEYNPSNPYYKQRAVWLEATPATKEALFDEVIIKLNKFYFENEIEIRTIWDKIKENNRQKAIESLKEEIRKLEEEIKIKHLQVDDLELNRK